VRDTIFEKYAKTKKKEDVQLFSRCLVKKSFFLKVEVIKQQKRTDSLSIAIDSLLEKLSIKKSRLKIIMGKWLTQIPLNFFSGISHSNVLFFVA
jgi:hypothetical protein